MAMEVVEYSFVALVVCPLGWVMMVLAMDDILVWWRFVCFEAGTPL
ncbi:hypothetical protein RchiOBHm_Chr4g0413681 [Rosa chinensis]|uniref:Transmembrane protein n=1 Tax=Rosa chinensis TaxID=74649 RepID=A0A2P6QW42_ROSCH|nr:hypothetical protein RchiOBHm_Chr4g0413681 [Rosa chinensis]